MTPKNQRFHQRHQHILLASEQLLLDNDSLTLDELAQKLDIAKGTLYKHFGSKDELYIQLLIAYENQLYERYDSTDSPAVSLARTLLEPLIYPTKATLYYKLEQQLTTHSSGLMPFFEELYGIRKKRMTWLFEVCCQYLDSVGSTLTPTFYLSTIWAMGQGGGSLLTSSFYQRYMTKRSTFILQFVLEALALPITHQPKAKPKPSDTAQAVDSYSPFGKLAPPSL